MNNKEHLTLDGFKKVLRLKAALPKGLDAAVFKDSRFSDIAPLDTSNIFVKNTSKLSPYYVAGFVAADGSFYISRPNLNTKWPNYDAGFSIAQNKRDELLLLRMIETLTCGAIKKDSNDMRYISVRNKKELPSPLLRRGEGCSSGRKIKIFDFYFSYRKNFPGRLRRPGMIIPSPPPRGGGEGKN